MREKYGKNRFGQSCLLARRLIEAGVRFVTVNMFETVFDEITWDIHGSKPFSPISCYRDLVGPMFDMAYSSLLEDLKERGLLTNTMVVAMGEFGRTPKVNPAGGRDHWPQCWTMLMAGGGDQRRTGGRRVGRNRRRAEGPADHARRRSPPPFITAWAFRLRSGIAGRAGPADSAGGSRRRADQGVVRMRVSNRCSGLVPLLLACRRCCSPRNLAILPSTVELNGPEARHQLLAEAPSRRPPGRLDAQRSSGPRSNPKVATVDANGLVTPVADGEATITATAQGRSATATVRVKDTQAPFTWSFRNDVIPVHDQGRLQSGRLPRRAGGQERIQADPARLRSGRRLRHADAPIRSAGASSCPSPRTA